MNGESQILVLGDLEQLWRRVALEFVKFARQAIAASDKFTVALSGGSTPKGLYTLLATAEFRQQISWRKVYLFWGDERCVTPDHPESNYRMAYEALISKVPILKENVFRMKGEKDPSEAAREYEDSLRGFFRIGKSDFPTFDLILLGLGEDGHTASLFPGSEAMEEITRLVAAPYVPQQQGYRLTLTLPVLNHAANVFFLVAGENKARTLKNVLATGLGPLGLPAQRVNPRLGRVRWFVDQEAARLL